MIEHWSFQFRFEFPNIIPKYGTSPYFGAWCLSMKRVPMNTYLVRINIQAGEYQKIVTTLVDAKTQQEAGKLALENECHAAS